MNKEITIIGAGICGLTTAIALGQKGIKVTVYEQVEELKAVGAGIWLQPNAVRVLDILGLEPKIKEAGSFINKMEITDAQLKPYKEITNSVVSDTYGNPTIGIHRAKLQDILLSKAQETAEIKFGHKYVSHQNIGDKIEITFKDTSITTDILLGADGIHSGVRKSLFPQSEIRNSHQMCWRGVVNYSLPAELKNKGKEAWGNDIRFGFSEIDRQENVYWFAVLKNESAKLSPQELANRYTNFNPIVADIIRSTAYIHTAELTDLKRIETWSNGNICLLGDAAHATTPNMGQGAGQGIEDALYIAHFLSSEKDANSAFKSFERERRKKVDYIVNNSWTFGKLAHSKVGRFFLTSIMRITPPSVMQNQMSKIYKVELP